METYQERVIEEKKELYKKLVKLEEFTIGKIFEKLSLEEQGRLNRQHSIMEDYLIVLGEQIAAF